MADRTTRAIGYIRTAIATDTHKKTNLIKQSQRIREYCRINKSALVGIFVDERTSGNTMARKGLQRALTTLRTGQAEILIVTNLSRITRSVAVLGSFVTEHFADDSRALVAVDEHFDTRTAQGRFILRALCLIAKLGRR